MQQWSLVPLVLLQDGLSLVLLVGHFGPNDYSRFVICFSVLCTGNENEVAMALKFNQNSEEFYLLFIFALGRLASC